MAVKTKMRVVVPEAVLGDVSGDDFDEDREVQLGLQWIADVGDQERPFVEFKVVPESSNEEAEVKMLIPLDGLKRAIRALE